MRHSKVMKSGMESGVASNDSKKVKSPRVLSDQEVQAELDRLQGDITIQTIVALQIHGGLRLSEILALSVQDVVVGGEAGGSIRVPGNCYPGMRDARTIPICHQLRRYLIRYFEVVAPSGPLFSTNGTFPLQQFHVFHRYRKATGEDFSPSEFQIACGARLRATGVTLAKIADHMGMSISLCSRYFRTIPTRRKSRNYHFD